MWRKVWPCGLAAANKKPVQNATAMHSDEQVVGVKTHAAEQYVMPSGRTIKMPAHYANWQASIDVCSL